MNDTLYDVLIVGGGPAGTAAAFRAAELGLSVAMIDRDEVLSLLRDWMSPDGNAAKDKLVDASFGPGGKKVPFPCGGELIDALVFDDRSPASLLYNRWRPLLDQRKIPAYGGVELVKAERTADGHLLARCVQPATREKPNLRARSMLLAMGRGVPTKLEMLGDTTGINYKLREVESYVGRPACVVGGGTSAAEAVIAMSNAKAAAGDPSDVFWSYRRRNLPKVNATLAKDFFAAFSGNGNIRYLPFSEPVAVLRGSDGSECVALRADRREVNGRPTEGTYLEFEKEQVLACIGADLPVGLLAELGVQQFRTVDEDDLYMAVTPWFESQVPGIYLIGDLLSPAFIQTTDFSPDAALSTVIDHIGNFKRGMLDGVLAVEGIAMRLQGATEAEVQALLDARWNEFKERHSARLAAGPPTKDKTADGRKAAVVEEAPAPTEPPPLQVGARIVRLEGPEMRELPPQLLVPGTHTFGRNKGQLTFPGDEQMLDDHAALEVDTDACYITTDNMAGQALVRVAVERTIEPGDVILAGRQRMMVESADGRFRLAVLDENGHAKGWLPVDDDGRTYGRQSSSRGIAVDGSDKSMSRRHFYLESAGSVVKLRDFGSMNGTYLEVRGTLRLNEGDMVFVGAQCIRFAGMQTAAKAAPDVSTKEPTRTPVGDIEGTQLGLRRPDAPPAAAAAAASAAAKAPAAEPPPAKAPAAKAAPTGAPSLKLQPIGKTVELAADQLVLDKLIADQLATTDPKKIGGNVQMLYSCKSGTCGKCVFEIVEGDDAVSKLAKKDERVLSAILPDLNDQGMDLAVEKCRLACKATVSGPAVVRLLGDTETA